jgi:hypothetical protein
MTPRFSERVGAAKVEIQLGWMDDNLRNTIWNFVAEQLPSRSLSTAHSDAAVKLTASNVLRVPTQQVDTGAPVFWLMTRVHTMEWAQVYDLLEYTVSMAPIWSPPFRPRDVVKWANDLLEREHSGYRFINGLLAPITNAAEISEVEGAVKLAGEAGLDGVRQQLEQALKLFGRRPAPDYANAIKEAVSAVEGTVKLINGSRGGGLHDALEALSAKIDLHPALKGALEKLYGYASDSDGIRHARLEAGTTAEAEARLMIVTCSAVVNFLIVKAEAAGLLKTK